MMRSIITGALAALLVLLPLAGAQAEEGKSKAAGTKYEAAKGIYLQGGWVVSKTNFNAGLDPNMGFDITGGYRFLPWLGADADFYWAGRDQGGGLKTRVWAITFNGKVYPIGLFAPKMLDSFQPYVVMGFGGGGGPVKDATTGTFVYRLGAGLDWMLTKRLGVYTDASLHATPGFKGGGVGGATGVWQLGAKFNF